MKKSLLLAGMAMTAAATIALAACNTGNTANNGSSLSTEEDIYGMGAVTTVKLLGSEFSAQALGGLSSVKSLSATSEEPASDPAIDQAEQFNKYFNMLDTMLGEGIVSTQVSDNTDAAYADYAYKMTITGKDIEGKDVTHLMYYTETLINEEKEKGEEEREYRLNGVMVVDGVDYTMQGGRTEEREKGETEDEIYIRAYPDAAERGTYVQVERESSAEHGETEEEYVYSVYQGGRLIEETSVEFEKERGHGAEEAEFELEFLQGGSRGRYAVERVSVGDNARMRVSYVIDGKSGVFHIRRTVDENGNHAYEYTFANGEVRCLPDEYND